MSFRFHVHRVDPTWRLVIAEGGPFPAPADETDWCFTLARERTDTAPDVARLVDENGYCLFRIGLSFDELNSARNGPSPPPRRAEDPRRSGP